MLTNERLGRRVRSRILLRSGWAHPTNALGVGNQLRTPGLGGFGQKVAEELLKRFWLGRSPRLQPLDDAIIEIPDHNLTIASAHRISR
jgi:hypothetical protein